METSRRKVTLESANGIIECNQAALLQIEALGETIEPYMLEDTPDVLTVGRRCQKYGWGFYWEPYSSTPYYRSPTGEKVKLVSIDYCPYLADTWNAENAPAVAHAPVMASKSAAAREEKKEDAAEQIEEESTPGSSSSSSGAAKAAFEEPVAAASSSECDDEGEEK